MSGHRILSPPKAQRENLEKGIRRARVCGAHFKVAKEIAIDLGEAARLFLALFPVGVFHLGQVEHSAKVGEEFAAATAFLAFFGLELVWRRLHHN